MYVQIIYSLEHNGQQQKHNNSVLNNTTIVSVFSVFKGQLVRFELDQSHLNGYSSSNPKK